MTTPVSVDGAAPAGPPSLWQLKPWWCQPWSILLTGIAVPAASWLLLHRWPITVPLAGLVMLWWWLFLVVAPRGYASEAQRRPAE